MSQIKHVDKSCVDGGGGGRGVGHSPVLDNATGEAGVVATKKCRESLEVHDRTNPELEEIPSCKDQVFIR